MEKNIVSTIAAELGLDERTLIMLSVLVEKANIGFNDGAITIDEIVYLRKDEIDNAINAATNGDHPAFYVCEDIMSFLKKVSKMLTGVDYTFRLYCAFDTARDDGIFDDDDDENIIIVEAIYNAAIGNPVVWGRRDITKEIIEPVFKKICSVL